MLIKTFHSSVCSLRGTGEPLLLGCLYPGSVIAPVVCDRLLHQTVTSDDLFPILRGLSSICRVQSQPTSPRGRKTTYAHTAMPPPAQRCPERCGLEFMLRVHLLSLGTEHSHKKMQLGESERDFIRSRVWGSPTWTVRQVAMRQVRRLTKSPLMRTAAWRLTTPEDPPSHFTGAQGTMQEIRISLGHGRARPSS